MHVFHTFHDAGLGLSCSTKGPFGSTVGSYRVTAIDSRSLEIPFELIGNHIVLTAIVAGRKFGIVVDTGNPAYGLVLIGSPAVDVLALDFTGRVPVSGAGDQPPFFAELAAKVFWARSMAT